MAIQPPQRFELDDLTHVEREARTIYAPGATPGDVLVVQSDHSLIAAPGGGSQPAQLLADVSNAYVVGANIDLAAGGLDPYSNGGKIDGVALADSTRVLVVGQDDPIENGVWLAHAGAWTRAADFAAETTWPSPTTVFVKFGDARGLSLAYLVNYNDFIPFVVGTDGIQMETQPLLSLFSGDLIGGAPSATAQRQIRLDYGAIFGPDGAPEPLLLLPSQFMFKLDDTPGAAKLVIHAQDSNGTPVTATIALAP